VNITFIGGGNMATALIGGLLGRGHSVGGLRVVEPQAEARARLAARFGVSCADSIAAAAPLGEAVVLAVKPQQMRAAAAALRPRLAQELVISIAAGIRMKDLSRWLGGYACMVRCMPNTPALVSAGITGLYASPAVGTPQRALAESILGAVGVTLWVADESLLDPLTAISGSGPAYVFYFIEALEQAGKELGLPEPVARQLALETVFGAAKLAHESTEDAATLRARVTSKNGTTERALLSLSANHVAEHIAQAAQAAAERSREMGDELGKA